MNNAYRRAVWLAAIRVGANVATLAAICVAMYMSSLHPAEGLLVFLQWFFGITVPLWVSTRYLCQFVRRRLADLDEGPVVLPGHRKSTLMRWRVAAPAGGLMKPERLQA